MSPVSYGNGLSACTAGPSCPLCAHYHNGYVSHAKEWQLGWQLGWRPTALLLPASLGLGRIGHVRPGLSFSHAHEPLLRRPLTNVTKLRANQIPGERGFREMGAPLRKEVKGSLRSVEKGDPSTTAGGQAAQMGASWSHDADGSSGMCAVLAHREGEFSECQSVWGHSSDRCMQTTINHC